MEPHSEALNWARHRTKRRYYTEMAAGRRRPEKCVAAVAEVDLNSVNAALVCSDFEKRAANQVVI
jgi:hypothetical protein